MDQYQIAIPTANAVNCCILSNAMKQIKYTDGDLLSKNVLVMLSFGARKD